MVRATTWLPCIAALVLLESALAQPGPTGDSFGGTGGVSTAHSDSTSVLERRDITLSGTKLFLPVIASAETSDYGELYTVLEIANITDSDVGLTLRFRGADGTALNMPIQEGSCPTCAVLGPGLRETVGAHGGGRIVILPRNPLKIGWAEFTADRDASLSVSAMLYAEDNDGNVGRAGIPPTSTYKRAWLYNDNTSDLTTTVVLVNPSATGHRTYQLRYRDFSDSSTCQTSVQVAALGYALIETADSLTCSSGDLGLVEISGDHEFTGIAIVSHNEDGRIFTRQFVAMSALGQDHPSLDQWTVTTGSVTYGSTTSAGCIRVSDTSIDGVVHTVHTSKWQKRADAESAWADVPNTSRTGLVCAYSNSANEDGQYRGVADISVGGERATYATKNVLTVGAPPGTTDSQPSFGATTVSNQSYQAGTAISPLTLPAASGGDGSLAYSLSPGVPGLTFNAATRVLAGTPTAAGTYNMTYTARDTDGDTARLSFVVTVATTQMTTIDLVVASVRASDDTPAAGQSFDLTATTSNRGTAAAPATTVRFYRSTNTTISGSDTQVGTAAVGALAAGGTISRVVTLTAPSAAGTYHYGACVDRVSGESDSRNNCSTAVRVTVTGSGAAGFRDDFRSTASLADWELVDATAAIDNGVLRLTGTVGSAARSLDSPLTSWTIKARMGRARTTDSFVGVSWHTGHSTYPECWFAIGPGGSYHLWWWHAPTRHWAYIDEATGGASDAIREGANELTEIALSYKNGVLKAVAGGTELFALPYSPTGRLGPALTNVTRIVLRRHGSGETTGLFDWVEIEGTPASGGDPSSVTGDGGDDFKPLSGLTITSTGALKHGRFANAGCARGSVTVNSVTYTFHWTEWQRRSAGSAWTQVAGTRRNGEMCGYNLANAPAGEYRFVGEMTVNGARGRYRSENTVTVGGSRNQSPMTAGTISDQTLVSRGSPTTMRVASAFTDPDGDTLSYEATTDDDNVATVGTSKAILRINPVSEGTTTVSVTATDAGGLSASISFGVTVERLPLRQHNIILRVAHVTTDWMPYASVGGWPAAAEPKESAALKYFEAAIWDETASVHLYEFDNDFNPHHDAGTDSARIAYREQHVVRKHTGMPRATGARQDFVKSAFADFARYIAGRFPASDHHLLYSGHGGPGGRLFGGMLSQEGAAEFLGTWRELLGRRLGVIDMGGPCNKGGVSDLETFCPHARYYIASDLPNGGYSMDDAVAERWERWAERWDEVSTERQYHSLFARHSDLEDALVGRIDLKRKRYEYSRGDMTANRVEQANYLYSCANVMSELGWNVALFIDQSGGTYGYGRDLLQYLTDNDAPESLLEMFDRTIIHQADNRDFFAWEEVANGIMMCC